MSKNLQRPEKARGNIIINKERKDCCLKWCRSKLEDLRGFLDNLSFLLPIFALFARSVVCNMTVGIVFFYDESERAVQSYYSRMTDVDGDVVYRLFFM